MLKYLTAMVYVILLGCGGNGYQMVTPPHNPQSLPPLSNYPDNYIVRGRWEMPITNIRALRLPDKLLASSNQAISGSVLVATLFTVSGASFATPALTTGVASYGTLNITTLSDNNLRVCGVGNNQKCTTAILRVYTTGVSGAGLWSTVEAVGLPITTGASTVGLNAGAAAIVSSFTILPSKRVIKLSDFTASPSYNIPISVDFTDAASGSYSSTLVVEYALQ